MNSPADTIDTIRRTALRRETLREAGAAVEPLRCDTQSHFERYLKVVNSFDRFFANAFRERRLLARDLRIEAEGGRTFQSYVGMDPQKVQIVPQPDGKTYSVYSLAPEQKIALCFQRSAAPNHRRACYQQVIDIMPGQTRASASDTSVPFLAAVEPRLASSDKPSEYCRVYNEFIAKAQHSNPDPEEIRLHVRSVGEMFQFLGDLLQYQDEVRALKAARDPVAANLNTPLTLGYCTARDARDLDPGCDNIFIRLDGERCNARFMVAYRDREYVVGNYHNDAAGCAAQPGVESVRDHTLEVLSVLHQLVGINKSASDIRATPFVQVVP